LIQTQNRKKKTTQKEKPIVPVAFSPPLWSVLFWWIFQKLSLQPKLPGKVVCNLTK